MSTYCLHIKSRLIHLRSRDRNECVLAVGAHPDDCEFGCFGTLANERSRGSEVFILLLTLGEKGGDPSVRYREAKEAAKIVGAELLRCREFS